MDEQERRFLASKERALGGTVIDFGKKYVGKRFDQVPLEYLDWCISSTEKNGWLAPATARLVREYLELPNIQRQLEQELRDKDGGDE